MGITIAYRGRLADLLRVEDFEDRVLDLALEFGGLAQIWRSHADDDPQRMVRGVLLNLVPGQEPVSLLLSPEGWLIGLLDIEDAERGRLTEPPWCFTKTQFGSLEGHVALAEMLAALQHEFLPDLEVRDEGGYHPTRDLEALIRNRGLVQQAINGLADALRRHGLSSEAAEDPGIVLRHVERVAAQVHRVLRRPSEHPPPTGPQDSEGSEDGADPEAAEALWDELFKHNRRQQERLQRALEERRSRGEGDEAFEDALRDLGLEVPGEDSEADEAWRDGQEWPAEAESGPTGQDESGVWDSDPEEGAIETEEDGAFARRHPLLERALALLKHLHDVFRGRDTEGVPALRTLFQGAGDTMGGLAQALAGREHADIIDDYGLRVVQLKRALRGVAFARGALFSLGPVVTPEQLEELQQTLKQMEQDIFHELSRVRAERRGDA